MGQPVRADDRAGESHPPCARQDRHRAHHRLRRLSHGGRLPDKPRPSEHLGRVPELRGTGPAMRDRLASEGGFTLVELLVVILIFAAISTSLYLAVFSGVRGGNTARNVVQISEEARLGLNRMIRDTREAKDLVA